MLVPSLACPARCAYCFGPHDGPTMSPKVAGEALDFMCRIADEAGMPKVRVTFHGGEPLLGGHALWRQVLDGLAARRGPNGYAVAVQSNLWLLDDGFCRLFREHRVEVGTSLDGPEEITDAQRGQGYFARTMQGLRLAQRQGLRVGCIATFTPQTASRWPEAFGFFLAERLGLSLHAAVPSLTNPDSPYALSAEQYGGLFLRALDDYVDHRREIRVSTLDQMCQGVACGDGKVCTFRDCLGMFIAIDPLGDLYPCQRLCGNPTYRLGNLRDQPELGELMASPVAVQMAAREAAVSEVCGDCPHLDYCRGGCVYNAWASGGPEAVRDPYCAAYRALFEHVRSRLTEEMASEANLAAIVDRPPPPQGHPLLRVGSVTELARGGRHPTEVATSAKRIVAAVELARGPGIPAVATRLVGMGIARTQQSGEASLQALQHRLTAPPERLNNLYLHLTFACQLDCTHCYARADAQGLSQGEMSVEALASLVRQAKESGFRQVILTGGEPLMHSRRDQLLETLRDLRAWAAPMNLVLRTNLAMPLAEDDLTLLASAVDQVVVSVDGDESTHDARRGLGAYAAVVRALEAYASRAGTVPSRGRPSRPGAGLSLEVVSKLRAEWHRHPADAPQHSSAGSGCHERRVLKSPPLSPSRALPPAELSLAAVLRASDAGGPPGEAVRELAARLGVRRTRFRPLLPLGRAEDWDEPPTSEAIGAHADPLELIEGGFQPVSGCGLGQNLYVEPSGESFPCYAYHQPHSYLGNVIIGFLQAVLDSDAFRDLCCHSVDTNPTCRTCEVRYLCGGACRAWGGEATQHDLSAPPPECAGLERRARALLTAALAYLAGQETKEESPCSDG